MIKEASTYTIRHLSEEQRASNAYGIHVLTSNKWIRPLRKTDIDMWVPKAGPSSELLALWRGASINWLEFIEQYQAEQQAHTSTAIVHYHPGGKRTESVVPMSPVDYLARLARHQVVTVLCWEQGKQCHRFTLTSLIEKQIDQMQSYNLKEDVNE